MSTITRRPLSKRTRFEVFKRDGFACVYCGAHPPDAVLHCDHIHPASLGGNSSLDNLVTACEACNLGKSNVPLSDVPLSLSQRAAEVEERERQIAGYEAVMRERRNRLEDDAQEVLNAMCEAYAREGVSQADFRSMKIFVERLGLDDVLWSAGRAHSQYTRSYRKGFLYFCGICWRKIREKEGTANGSNSQHQA